MASRFWVGGTGTWDTTTTTHWSATSGGAGGASAPTLSDDVFLDASSGAAVVTLGASVDVKSLTCTGFTGTLDGLSLWTITARGTGSNNIIFVAGMTVSGLSIGWGSGAIGSLTTAGKTIRNVTVGGGSSGGTTTLADALTVSNVVNLTSGTLDTNGQTCNWLSFFSSNSNTRVLTLGASTITVTNNGTAWDCTTSTGLTINPGTSSIVLSGTSAAMNTGGKTWYDVSFTGSGQASIGNSGCSFHNLTRIGTAVKTDSFAVQSNTGNYTVTGTFTITGNSATNRVLFSGPLGAAGNVPAAAVSLTNVNFKDITASGAASPWTGTSLGDCGGNTGITFDAPVTAFWVGDTGNYSDTTHWSSTSGGAGSTTRVPLPQDTAKWDANSFSATSKTVTLDMPHMAAMDYSAITKSGITYAFSLTSHFVYGSIQGHATNGSFTGSAATVNTAGRGSFTLGGIGTQVGLQPNVAINAPGGTYTLTSNIGSGVGGTASNRIGALNVSFGTLDLAGFSFALFNVNTTSGSTRSLLFNNGTIITRDTVTSTVWNSSSAGLTLSAVGGLIVQDVAIPSGITLTFTGGGLTFGTLQHTVAGSQGNFTITGSNSFQDIVFSDTSNTRTMFLQVGTVTTIRSSTPLQSFLGTSGKLMGLRSSSAGTTATIDLPNGYGSSNYLTVQDIVVTTKPWYAGSNSTNGGNNTNVIFSTLAAAITAALTLGMSAGGSASPGATANLSLSAGATGSASPPATAALALLLAATGQAADTAVASLVLSLAATAQAPDTSSAAISLAMAATAGAPDTATAVLALSMLAGATASPAPTAALALVLLSAAQATPSPTAAISLSIIATAVIGILRDITASAEIVPGRMSAGVVEQKRMSATVLP